MAINSTRLAQLFQRYTNGEATRDERDEFLALINQAPSDPELEKLLSDLWYKVDDAGEPANSERVYAAIVKAIPLQEHSHSASGRIIKYALAACVALFILFSIVFIGGKSTADHPIAAVETTKQLPRNTQWIVLPDGSTVILNEGSKLEYPPTFDGLGTREVTLRGEAYFDIKHDISRPFIVHTGKLKTTVLGTAFNISAYDSAKNITVTVSRGKVKVDDEQQELAILSIDEQISFDRKKHTTERKSIDSKKSMEWIEDIIFDDVTFQEAAVTLQKRFHIRILFANEKLHACRFTASFMNEAQLEDILMIICEFNNADYKMVGNDEIVIDGKGCYE